MRTNKKQHRSKTASTPLVDLTTAEVHRLAKPKEGFGTFVDQLVELYTDNGGNMPGFEPDSVRSEFAQTDALTSTLAEQRTAMELTVKTRALHASNAWRGTLLIYKWAQLAGRNNPAILRGVARFEQFMKQRPHKAPATTATTMAPSGSTATTSAGTSSA